MKARTALVCVSLITPVLAWASADTHGDNGPASHATSGHGDSSKHASGGHGGNKPHWSYSGHNGPESWGSLAEEFGTCSSGRNQSPINIDYTNSSASMFKLEFNYLPVPLQIVNNGHTIQFNYGTPKHGEENFVTIAGRQYPLPTATDYHSTLSVSGEEYKLIQVHFHSPSEHQFNGRNAPMEAHFVHMNDAKQLAVVGVMLTEGKSHPLLSQLWPHMPMSAGPAKEVAGVHVNAADLLPREHEYNHYRGSLTTPPCTEGVRWFVMQESVDVSSSQVAKFLSVINENARPVQPVNNRYLLSSN